MQKTLNKKKNKDYFWLTNVFSHKENKLIHYKAMIRLLNLFEKKWEDDILVNNLEKILSEKYGK